MDECDAYKGYTTALTVQNSATSCYSYMNFSIVDVDGILEAYLIRLGDVIPLGAVVFREAVGMAVGALDETEDGRFDEVRVVGSVHDAEDGIG